MTRAALAILLLLGGPLAGAVEQVETIDAVVLSGQVVSIGDKTFVLRVGDKQQIVPRDQIVDVTFDRAERAVDRMAQAVVTTHRGDVIAAAGLKLDNGHFKFTNSLLGQTQIAMSDVAAVFLPGSMDTAGDIQRRCKDKKITATSQDTLVVLKAGKLMSIRGVLKGIGILAGSSEMKVSFRWQETDRTVSLSTVRAIVLAKTPVKSIAAGGTLTGRDGTQVRFTSLTLTGRTCQVNTIVAGAKTIVRKAVASIRFNTPIAVDLSSVKPSSVTEYGFFDRTFPHRVDASVSGGPLRLDGREYSVGLGLHSFCELTYALEGKYSRLVTVAGIDDRVRPAGNAELSFFGDGKRLGKPTPLTGKDRAKVLRVSLAGVKTLTIRVDFGPDGLDVADHVNLAAARLIKAGN